jgi:hypothetical protein
MGRPCLSNAWARAFCSVAKADFVLISHVLVDFPPAKPKRFFRKLLNDAMGPGAQLLVFDRFHPRCLAVEAVPLEGRLTARVDIPGTSSGSAGRSWVGGGWQCGWRCAWRCAWQCGWRCAWRCAWHRV